MNQIVWLLPKWDAIVISFATVHWSRAIQCSSAIQWRCQPLNILLCHCSIWLPVGLWRPQIQLSVFCVLFLFVILRSYNSSHSLEILPVKKCRHPMIPWDQTASAKASGCLVGHTTPLSNHWSMHSIMHWINLSPVLCSSSFSSDLMYICSSTSPMAQKSNATYDWKSQSLCIHCIEPRGVNLFNEVS